MFITPVESRESTGVIILTFKENHYDAKDKKINRNITMHDANI